MAVVVLTALLAAVARGQVVQVDATYRVADHYLLGEPLRGATVTIGQGAKAPRVSFELEKGRAERTGSTCSGLIPPGGCPSEPLTDRATHVAAGIGWDLHTFSMRGFSFIPSADARISWLDVSTHGESSGDEIEANKRLLTFMGGGRVRWRPGARWALQVGAEIGVMNPLTLTHVADGYTPFEESFRFSRWSIGGIWTPGR